jgi:hypothetical protein
MHFAAACTECEWYARQEGKEYATYFGIRHSNDFGHRVEFREEYEDTTAYESCEPEELLRDRSVEGEERFDGDFNSEDRFTS